MNDFLKRHSPPGMELKFERRFVLTGWLLSFLYSLLFLDAYFSAWNDLFIWEKGSRVLIKERIMPDFAELIESYLLGFFIVSLCMIGFVIYRYAYYRQGSKSIYLMKRLPHKSERHRRAWLLPLLAALVSILIALTLLLLYFTVYMLVTPDECVSAGQWYKIWRF